MLKRCLASILAVTLLMAVLALLAPAAPAAAHGPLPSQGSELPENTLESLTAWWTGLWQDVLGVFSAAACNAEDPCAGNACNPELCPTCNPDPCHPNACNPDPEGCGNSPRMDPHG